MSKEINYFTELNQIDVSDKVEKKKSGNTMLSYLSWAFAWGEVKKLYPDASYNIHKYGEDNQPYLYDKNTGYMVTTDVTIDGITHEMWLPVMDHSNKAMKSESYTYNTRYKKDIVVESATMFDINKAIMRCLVKNIAMHGLGLYIYAGEDLPEVPEAEITYASKEQIKDLIELFVPERIEAMLKAYKIDKLQDLPEPQAKKIIEIERKNQSKKEVENVKDIS